MLAWLTGDPLNGIIVTITFFISLVISRYLSSLGDAGKTDKKIDSRIKIMVSFLLIIALTMMKHWYFPIAVSAICALFAARIHIIRDFCKRLIFPAVLALFIFAIQSLTYGAGTKDFIGIITVHPEGIAYGFLIFSRVLASASVLVILVLTTSGNEMLESMRSLGIPGTMLEISSFMGRYIKAFSIEGKK